MRDRGRKPTRRRRNVLVAAPVNAVFVVLADARLALRQLIFVGELVDQPEPEGVVGHERTLIQDRADVGLALLPALRDPAHQLVVHVAIERLGHLTMLRRESLLGELIRRRLVLADVEEVGIGPDLVERAAQEDLVRGHAGQIQRAARQQEDSIGRAGQVVLAVAAVLEKGDDPLPGLPEVEDGVTQLLHLAPVRQLQRRRHQQDRLDARVAFGLVQVVHEAAHGIDIPAEHLTEDIVGDDLLELAAGSQHQRGRRWHRRRARDREIHERDARDRHEHGETDERESETDAAA